MLTSLSFFKLKREVTCLPVQAFVHHCHRAHPSSILWVSNLRLTTRSLRLESKKLAPKLISYPADNQSDSSETATLSLVVPPSRPCLIGGDPAFSVRCLDWSRHQGRGLQIDWEGYGPEDRSWFLLTMSSVRTSLQTFFAFTLPRLPSLRLQ